MRSCWLLIACLATGSAAAGAENGPGGVGLRIEKDGAHYDIFEGMLPVLRYSHGSVPVPPGRRPHFAAGETYERGDYISRLFGPAGELVSEDYPADHPHHRAVWWSWPVTRWGDKLGDIWAVVKVHARPLGEPRLTIDDGAAVIQAQSVWKWADGTSIAKQDLVIRVFPATDRGRLIDVEVRLTALQDDVAIGGRPGAGYGGFAFRAAPGEGQKVAAHTDPDDAAARLTWIDYSAVFPGGRGRTGITLFEHPSNPGYPNLPLTYPQLNCVMSAFPGDREVPLSKEKPLELRHRLWIRSGAADEKTLREMAASYAAE